MTKRGLLIALSFLLLTLSAGAQIYNPVTWDFNYEKKSGIGYELIFTATIEKGSHIYAMDIPEGGPIPTTFSFSTPVRILHSTVKHMKWKNRMRSWMRHLALG